MTLSQAAVFHDVMQDRHPSLPKAAILFFLLSTHPLGCDPHLPGRSCFTVGQLLLLPVQTREEQRAVFLEGVT